MNKQELIKLWDRFTKDKDFILNPDIGIVEKSAEGVLKNEKEKGYKFCPCKLISGDFGKDIIILCPCNFFIQSTWKKEGKCWCGLFVKK